MLNSELKQRKDILIDAVINYPVSYSGNHLVVTEVYYFSSLNEEDFVICWSR